MSPAEVAALHPKRVALPPLTEADITRQIKGYMESQGWFAIRLQSGMVRGMTRGTPMRLNANGTPDWLFMKGTRYLFVEMKRPRGKLSQDQEKWFAMADRRGFPAIWADGLGAFIEKLQAYERIKEIRKAGGDTKPEGFRNR